MKKSGLADSPFFAIAPSPPPIQPVHEEKPLRPGVQENILPERSPVQPFTRSVERLNERPTEPMNGRSSVQVNERPAEHPGRPIFRQSYDIFRDQADAIEELRMRWSKQRRKYITKGQVVRELLDDILTTKGKPVQPNE